MVVSQRDGRGTIPGARQKSPTVGQRWSHGGVHRSPTQQRPERGYETVPQEGTRRSWRPLEGMLRLRTLRRCATASSVSSGPGRRLRPWRCGWTRWSVGGSYTSSPTLPSSSAWCTACGHPDSRAVPGRGQRCRPLPPQAAGGGRPGAGRGDVRRARPAHPDRLYPALARVRPSGWPSSRRFINQLGPPWSPMRCRPTT